MVDTIAAIEATRTVAPRTVSRLALSVIVPVYRSAQSLTELAARLSATLSALTSDWEIIFVDDASPDDSFEVLRRLRAADPRVKIIRLAQNRGQHHATLCGLHYCTGDYVFTIDDDLQAPPEELPRFLTKLEEGYDVVIGKIPAAANHRSLARTFASHLHRRMTERVLAKPKHLALSSYRGLSRTAVENIKQYRGAHPQIAALIFKGVHPSSITNVEFNHQQRRYGSSTYSALSLVKLSSYILINHSYLPLRMMIAWGMLMSVGSFAFAAAMFYRVLVVGVPVVGWASLAILVSFLSGNILFALGVLGEYMGRMVEEFSSPTRFGIHRIEL